jgi:hypothetical protein
MDKEVLRRKATTYIKSLEGVHWNNSIKFTCQSPECRGSVTNQNSGVYMPDSGRVFCWQPNCRFSHDRARKGRSFSIKEYIAVCSGGNVDIDGKVDSESYKQLESFLEHYPEDNTNYVSKVRVKKQRQQGVPTPPYQIPINIKSGDPKAVQYVKNRGFDPQWLWDEFKISYICRESKISKHQDYNGYIIIPYYDEIGRVVFYQGRDYLYRPSRSRKNPDGILRWMNPSVAQCGVGKSDFIFNSQHLGTAKDIYISEAVWDAIELSQIPNDAVKGSLGGSSISDEQLAILEKAENLENIYIIMDGGAFLASLLIAEKILSSHILRDRNVYVVPIHMYVYPNGKKKKDANEHGYIYMWKQIRNEAIEISKLNLMLLKMKVYRVGNDTFMDSSYYVRKHEESEDHDYVL